VDDFKLASHHANAIAKAIQEQLHEHDSHSPEDGEGDARSHTISVDRRTQSPSHDGRERGALDAAGEAWWTCWRKRIRTEDGYVRVGGEDRDGDADDEGIGKKSKGKARQKRKGRSFGVMVPEVMGEGPMEVDQIQVENVGVDEELRILIKVRRMSAARPTRPSSSRHSTRQNSGFLASSPLRSPIRFANKFTRTARRFPSSAQGILQTTTISVPRSSHPSRAEPSRAVSILRVLTCRCSIT
jgi:hypothetical protein